MRGSVALQRKGWPDAECLRVLSPCHGVRGLLRRGAVYGLATAMRAGDSVSTAARGVAGEVQQTAASTVQEAQAVFADAKGQETIFRRWDKVCTDCSFWLDDFCLLRSCQRLPVADTCTFFHESRSLDPQGAAGSCTVNR